MSTPSVIGRQHPLVKRCRALATHREPGVVLLDGEHLVADALAAGVSIEALLTDDRPRAIVTELQARRIPCYTGSGGVLEAASPVRTPSGVVAIARWTPQPVEALFGADRPLVLGLVDVQDPGNVGSVIRTADALGASGVVTIGESADPAGWKALRGAMGSTFRVPVARAPLAETLQAARAQGLRVAATVATGGTPLDQASFDQPLLLLLGHEGAGLPTEVIAEADVRLTIPMRAAVNSLNVSVTAAVCLWEARRTAAPRP